MVGVVLGLQEARTQRLTLSLDGDAGPSAAVGRSGEDADDLARLGLARAVGLQDRSGEGRLGGVDCQPSDLPSVEDEQAGSALCHRVLLELVGVQRSTIRKTRKVMTYYTLFVKLYQYYTLRKSTCSFA